MSQPLLWPVCPECGLSSSVMNDVITQRLPLTRRVQFKFRLAECYLCADVYHRERMFLEFAAEALYPTAYGPPVCSDERLTLTDFLALFGNEGESGAPASYQGCFRCAGGPAAEPPRAYLSNFSVAELSLVNRQRVQQALARLSSPLRTITLLYLMGVRSYDRLSETVEVDPETVKQILFLGRRQLQDAVMGAASNEIL